MSTILDALKKSERERKLNSLPTLSDMPPPQETSRLPILLLGTICALLLLLLMVVLAQWWFTHSNSPPAAIERNKLATTTQTTIEQDGLQRPVDAQRDVALSIEVVSFSEQPSQRFVMIDGKMVREQEFVQPGVLVEEIQRNAVVLNIRGQRVTRTP